MPNLKKDRLLFILNPIAGRTHGKKGLHNAIEILKEHYNIVMKKTDSKGHATELVLEYGDKYDLIVCSGGDGTLNEVISGIMQLEKKVLLGYIPSGTTNDFASSLNISNHMDVAAMSIINGTPRTIDIGLFGEKRYF